MAFTILLQLCFVIIARNGFVIAVETLQEGILRSVFINITTNFCIFVRIKTRIGARIIVGIRLGLGLELGLTLEVRIKVSIMVRAWNVRIEARNVRIEARKG